MGEYRRPPGAHEEDFHGAREVEELVGSWLGEYKVGNLDSLDRLDWWVPGLFLDVKEKRQPLSTRWTQHIDWPERDAFVIDELSVRRAAEYFPHAYFLILDNPVDRWFLARVDEVFSAERKRLNRNTSGDNLKGKWVINLKNFRQLDDPENQLLPTVLHDQVQMPWKLGQSVSMLPIGDV